MVTDGSLGSGPTGQTPTGTSRARPALSVALVLLVLLILEAGLVGASTMVSPIRIASVFSRTGGGAEEYSPSFPIIRIAAQEINAQGGLLGRPLEILEFDTRSTALGAREAALAAVAAGVVAVIGPSWSYQAMAMGPVLQQAGIPMIGTTTTAPEVTRIGDHIFRICYTDTLQADVLARFAFEDLKARHVVIVTVAGDIYSEGVSSGFAQRFSTYGGTVDAQLRYLQNAMDFSPQIREIQRHAPDMVLVPGFTRDSGLLLKQARGSGLTMPFLGGDGWTGLEHYPYLARPQGENYFISHWHPQSESPASLAFVDLMRREFGPDALKRIDATNANAYDAINVVAEAIRRGRSAEPAAIRDALTAIDGYPGVTGTISFGRSRDPAKPLFILRMTPDRIEFVKRLEAHP